MLQNLWGRPPGLRGTPSSRSPPVESRPCTRRWPTRASAADEGVRPTIYADVRLWENYVALPLRSRFGVTRTVRTESETPAESRRQPGLAAPQDEHSYSIAIVAEFEGTPPMVRTMGTAGPVGAPAGT